MDRPAYFDISPAAVLPDASESLNLQNLAELAGVCVAPFPDSESTAPGTPPPLRLFSTWEITRYLIPVDPVHFRRVLRQNPNLPQGESRGESGTKWFTMAQVQILKAFFHSTGSQSRGYLPYRPNGLPARIAAVGNSSAGTGKTTVCAHLAVSAAMDGYRVLVVDLDGRAGLTRILHGEMQGEGQTALSLIAGHYARHQQLLNRLRMERGEAPVPIDEDLDRAARADVADLTRPTRWPNLDLIAGGEDLEMADLRIAGWRLQARNWKFWEALGQSLAQDGTQDGALDRYDLVLIDTPSDLGHLSLAGLAGANLLLVPLEATRASLYATGRFLARLRLELTTVEEAENVAARALGTEAAVFGWEALRAVLTRYDAARQSDGAGEIQASLGPLLWSARQAHTPLVGPEVTVYDTDYRDCGRETFVRARDGFDETYAAFKRLLVGSWRREEKARGQS